MPLLLCGLALPLGLLAFSSGDRAKAEGGRAPGGRGRGALRSCLRCRRCTVFSFRPARRPAAVARLKFSAFPRLVSPPKAHTGGVITTKSLLLAGAAALSFTSSLVPPTPLPVLPPLGADAAAAAAAFRLRLPLMLAKAADTTETGEFSNALPWPLPPPPLKKDNSRLRLLLPLLLLLLRLLLLVLLLASPPKGSGKEALLVSKAAARA